MATIMHTRVRPSSKDDYRAPSRPRVIGLIIATIGLTTLGFGTVKLGIGVILWGILMKLWLRVDAVKDLLTKLVDVSPASSRSPSEIRTEYGPATVTAFVPAELSIHRMAKAMWRPMLAMGIMAVAIGSVISLSWAQTGSLVASTWTQGLQFLGEAMLLAGVSFLLGTILWAIRTGGGEVQHGLGVAVKTLKMPTTAKVFVALMMTGLMVSIAQFVGYLIVAAGSVDAATWLAFLGPLRELGLGLLLAGIAMALVTIGNVLGFQFDRVIEIIKTGK